MVKYVQFLELTGIGGWLDTATGLDSLEYSENSHASDPKYKIYNNSFDSITFNSLEYTNGSIDIYDNPNLASKLFSISLVPLPRSANVHWVITD